LNKKITVVIVTFNGENWIEKNINSILTSDYPISILVIDNKSTDNTLAILSQFPAVEIIKSQHNLGFGKANNIGIQYAFKNKSDAVFLLNQDTRIFKNTISSLVAVLKQNTNLGIISPMHFSGDNETLDANFKTYLKSGIKNSNNTIVVPFVNAAAWLVSKECFEKVGFFEPIFNHYGEDRNYCNRVIYHGFDIGIDEKSKIIHDRAITRNLKKDTLQSRYVILNSFLNINNSFLKSSFVGLKSVFGLPKYFLKFYGWNKVLLLLLHLVGYFTILILHLKLILKIRKNTKLNFSEISEDQ